jgi:ppGpp synthetase/RelA/SpoT-type nucleotidyltranferase
MNDSRPKPDALEAEYRRRHETVLKPLASAVSTHIADCVKGQPRVDRVTARAKDVASFIKKANKVEDGAPKYSEPLSQIQDQIGARIITFYLSDVEALDGVVMKYFTAIESKLHVPDREWEFGYFGKHYVLVIPSDVIDESWDKALVPRFFELQIKTLFQHAWSEAEHDIGYKETGKSLDLEQKRRLAFTSAQAWGADMVFNELFAKITSPSAAAK